MKKSCLLKICTYVHNLKQDTVNNILDADVSVYSLVVCLLALVLSKYKIPKDYYWKILLGCIDNWVFHDTRFCQII